MTALQRTLRDAAGTSADATGRSENRIFGDCVFPKNGANQVPPGFFLFRRLLLLQKPSVGGIEVVIGVNHRKGFSTGMPKYFWPAFKSSDQIRAQPPRSAAATIMPS